MDDNYDAELSTSEDQFDTMMAAGEPVSILVRPVWGSTLYTTAIAHGGGVSEGHDGRSVTVDVASSGAGLQGAPAG